MPLQVIQLQPGHHDEREERSPGSSSAGATSAVSDAPADGAPPTAAMQGSYADLMLDGEGSFASFPMSFSYEIVQYTPQPAATLVVSGLRATIEPLGGGSKKPRAAPPTTPPSGAVDTVAAPAAEQAPRHVLRLTLLEELGGACAQTSACALKVAFFGPRLGSVDWAGEVLELGLPFGSPRPPLVRLEFWGDKDAEATKSGSVAASDGSGAEELSHVAGMAMGAPGAPCPQASVDVRLPEDGLSGSMEVLLTGALGFDKDVRLSLSHETLRQG